MKYSIEEIKTLLEGITPGAWAAEEVQYQWKTSNALGKHILCIYTEPDAKFIAAAPTIIRDLLAEVERLREDIEQLRVQLAACGVAAMCNTKQSRRQQKCAEGDYGWSQSYQDVVDAVGREIALREQLQAAQAENDRLTAKLGFYDNKCPVCNSTLGLLHADACPLCAARKEVERLQRHIEADAELYAALEESHRAVNEQLRIEGQRAARHLADQELLVGQERKRVARECIDYVNNHASDCGCSKRIAHDIREHYGVEG